MIGRENFSGFFLPRDSEHFIFPFRLENFRAPFVGVQESDFR